MKFILAAVLLGVAIPAHAERYRVDLILFADKTGVGDEAPLAAQPPDLARSLEPTDTAKLRAAGIDLLPDEKFALMDHWKKLTNSQRQQPLLRLAWLQKDPPSERGVSLRLRSGALLSPANNTGTPVYAVDGTVSLLLGRFLHLDADLVHTQTNSAGELKGYRMKERRRMRRNELHHLDSPRLGLLVRVQKAEK